MPMSLQDASAIANVYSNNPPPPRICTQSDLDGVAEELRNIKAAMAAFEDQRKSDVAPLNERVKAINADAKAHVAPLESAETTLKTAIAEWQRAERERIAREQAIADEKARKERERLAAQAAKAEAAGKTERAEALQAQAQHVVAPVLQPQASTKGLGVSMRSTWGYRVKNDNDIPREYMRRDDQKIGSVVRAMKGETNIPGIEVFEEVGVAARGAR